jgi:predicted MFS family arabinose efflux permease
MTNANIIQLGSTDTFYGFVVSSFSLGQIIGAPTLGALSTRRNPKIAMIVGLSFIIFGDMFYLLSPNEWTILVSRIISGFGTGLYYFGYRID